MSFVKKQDLANCGLPDTPGVYFFRDEDGAILYIGKATSLSDRVKSYFSPDLAETRGLKLVNMVLAAKTVTFEETDSVLEALLRESVLIKKHQPSFNSKEKDDKSFYSVVITKEDFPRILMVRSRDLEKKFTKSSVKSVYGPFTSSSQLKEALKIVRKIFPYRDTCQVDDTEAKPCFNAQIGLCPGSCYGQISSADYKKTIKNIEGFFAGEKETIKKSLIKDMEYFSKRQEFEKAGVTRNALFSLDHIKDTSLIKDDLVNEYKDKRFRIEAFDSAHISGTSRVGVMTVIEGGEKDKSSYRKFILEEGINDDYGGLITLLKRRFAHAEWRTPDLIVVDGGEAHRSIAEKLLVELSILVPVVSVVKDKAHKPKDILGNKVHVDSHKKDILLANAEAHRFAITFHKEKRSKALFR
jgi:excinuclease UvrABC nuclease subunit